MAEGLNLVWGLAAGESWRSADDRIRDQSFRRSVARNVAKSLETQGQRVDKRMLRRIIDDERFFNFVASDGAAVEGGLGCTDEDLEAAIPGLADGSVAIDYVVELVIKAFTSALYRASSTQERAVAARLEGLDQMVLSVLNVATDIQGSVERLEYRLASAVVPVRRYLRTPPAGGEPMRYRSMETERVRVALAQSNRRTPVVVSGVPGVGKTTLAIEYALQFRDRYDAIVWFDAEDPSALLAQVVQVGRVISGERLPFEDALQLLRSHIADTSSALVVYDNVESVADVHHVLPSAGTSDVILTSRDDTLSVHYEVVRVEPLTVEQTTEWIVDATECDRAAASIVAGLVEGLPLAIWQAVHLLRTGVDPTHLSERWYLLSSGVSSVAGPPDHPSPVSVSVQAALGGLGRQARVDSGDALRFARCLARLSPFVVPPRLLIRLGERTAVSPTEAVQALRRLGLLRGVGAGVQMHRLIAQGVLETSAERSMAADLAVIAALLVEDAPGSDGAGDERWWELHLPHVLSVARSSQEFAEDVTSIDISVLAARRLYELGQFHESLLLAEQALSLVEHQMADPVLTLGVVDLVANVRRALTDLDGAFRVMSAFEYGDPPEPRSAYEAVAFVRHQALLSNLSFERSFLQSAATQADVGLRLADEWGVMGDGKGNAAYGSRDCRPHRWGPRYGREALRRGLDDPAR